MNEKTFRYGRYQYSYFEIRENRKTLSLSVLPDSVIVLKAPLEASSERINSFLQRKWLWLKEQLKFFEKYRWTECQKEYVSGENFLYLGRQFQLKVLPGKRNGVILNRGQFKLTTSGNPRDGIKNKEILDTWFEAKREIKFKERYSVVLKNFDYSFEPQLTVRKMKKRWGSYLSGKKIILNPDLIKVPTQCIDYVITHELCHMKHKKHNRDFYKLLTAKMPDWEKRKEKLELSLVDR